MYEQQRLDWHRWRGLNFSGLFLQHLQVDVALWAAVFCTQYHWRRHDLRGLVPDPLLAFFYSGRHMDDSVTDRVGESEEVKGWYKGLDNKYTTHEYLLYQRPWRRPAGL